MNESNRLELKYQINVFDYFRLKNRLACYADPDQYSQKSQEKRYLVRSLYYDTFDYRAYVEKITGEPYRIKLRVRSYYPQRTQAPFVNVELKARWNNFITKYSTRVPLKEFDHFHKTGSWLHYSSPVLIEFERLIRLRNLAPKVLVEYEREAYVAKDHSGVRLTFDHGLRFASVNELYPEGIFLRKKNPYMVIFEIKIKNQSTHWLERIIEEYGLKVVPNSKYTLGIEQTQQAINF